MADIAGADREDLVESESDSQGQQARFTPIDFAQYDFIPGAKAPWRCSPSDCYGPDELGEFKGCIDELIAGVERADAAARICEVLQAWEQRLFRRNYHFLNVGWKGWGMFGGSSGTTGASILQTQNSMKLFSCNVFGARHKKITALLSREVPPVQVVPEDDEDTMDQQASQEATPYLKAFREQAKMKRRLSEAASYLYTDGAAVFLTYTVASSGYGQEQDEDGEMQPARREEVEVFGKLERKTPMMADTFEECGWIRLSREHNRDQLRARYPWIRDRISGGANKDAMGQLDRMARANVRLAVQASSTSGEAYASDTTESVFFFRPYQYEAIADADQRQTLYDEFPSGLEVWTAGGEIALVREGSFDDHVSGCHATPGDGQNRESIGTNYLPIQKVLNASISLYDRYFRGAVPRRYAMEPVIDVEAANQQSNDPAKFTPVDGEWLVQHNLTIQGVTGIETVPQPNDAILQYIQWLISGAPEAMDGGSPAVFGIEADAESKGTFGEARLDRDQALQVFSLPWGELSMATAQTQAQAIKCAADNRQADFTVGLPGERVRVSVKKLRGDVLVWPTSTEIPPTVAEQQAEIGQMLQSAGTVPLYGQILADPRNLELLRKMPSLTGLHIPGWDDLLGAVDDTQKALIEGPVPNPQIGQLEQQIQQLDQQAEQAAMQAQDPMQRQQIIQQAQQQVAQLTQALQQLEQTMPQVSSIPVPQDASQDHQIYAAIALAAMKSAKGRAAQSGDEQAQAGWLNLKLYWQAHAQVAAKLSPPPPMDVRGSFTADITKLPPAAQAIAFERLKIAMPPDALQAQPQEHEVTEETEGLNPQGVPTKRKVSVVGKPLS